MADCIFSRVARGEVPADKVYEDELITAFRDTPTLMPYDALQPQQSLAEVNQKNAYRAKDSDELALDRPDEADAQILNAILWHAVKGTHVPMPRPKTVFRSHPLQDD